MLISTTALVIINIWLIFFTLSYRLFLHDIKLEGIEFDNLVFMIIVMIMSSFGPLSVIVGLHMYIYRDNYR